MYTSKFPSRKRLAFLTLVTVCLLFTAFSPTEKRVYAASYETNPMVAIVLDHTSPKCLLTRVVMVPVTHAIISRTQSHCPPGTALKAQIVPLSEAIASHKEYVLLPSPNSLKNSSSKAACSQADQQIEQLMVSARAKISSAATTRSQVSASSCGYDVGTGTSDNNAGWNYWTEVNYHVSSTCDHILVTDTYVYAYSTNNTHQLNYYGFYLDNYGGQRWGPPDCRWIAPGNYSHWPSALNGQVGSTTYSWFYFLLSLDFCIGPDVSSYALQMIP